MTRFPRIMTPSLSPTLMHLLLPQRNLDLLQRIRIMCPDGARLLLVDFWTDPTHTQPVFAALMAGAFLLRTGEGDVYSEEEVRGWLQETGWRPVEHKALRRSRQPNRR